MKKNIKFAGLMTFVVALYLSGLFFFYQEASNIDDAIELPDIHIQGSTF